MASQFPSTSEKRHQSNASKIPTQNAIFIQIINRVCVRLDMQSLKSFYPSNFSGSYQNMREGEIYEGGRRPGFQEMNSQGEAMEKNLENKHFRLEQEGGGPQEDLN